MKVTIVAGARPNFIKIAPLIAEINQRNLHENISYRLVHTGQHYDDNMSSKFFKDLDIPQPHINLNCGGGTQAEQTAQIMLSFEKDLIENPTNLVIVVGDVNSTLACSIVAKKLKTQVAHIEAGIRSFDLSMPEEINRMVTDSISDYFFTTTKNATTYLKKTGVSQEKVFFVGNIMIDTLLKNKPRFTKPYFWDKENLNKKEYFVMTLHRPSNVDESESLMNLINLICKESNPYKIIFPIHPRTKQKFNFKEIPENLILTEPLGYLEFNYLVENSIGVLTDSGGITEECTLLNIPCVTLRENTERPETVTIGSNELAGKNHDLIKDYIQKIKSNHWKTSQIPELWDGKTAERIVNIISKITS